MALNVPVQVAAVAADTLVDSLGINTHLDFSWSSYNDLGQVQNALAFLGVENVRDSIDNPADLAKFATLNQDLGVKFDFFIAPGDVGMPWQLRQIESDPAIVRFVEGPNESDNWPVSYDGLTGFAATAAEQQALYTSVKAELPGVPVIGPSFGQLGSFPLVRDLAAAADYANAHIYFGTGNSPGDQSWIQTVLADASLVVPGKPLMTTETGYYTSTDLSDPNGVDPTVQAKYILDDVMDQFAAGVSMDYLYELVDEQPDPGNTNSELHFGLFNSDWTPKPAAIAIHDLLQLLQDPGAAGFTPGTLDYSLTGMPAAGQSKLLEKSDGTFVLVLWNDARLAGPVTDTDLTVAPTAVTLTLGSPAALIDVYDPLTGTSVVRSASNTGQITVNVPDHPILIEIGPNAGAAIVQSAVPPAPVLSPDAPTGVSVNAPATVTVASGQTVNVAGVSITDPWAAGMLGGMALNLSADGGTLTLTDAAGNPVAGSGTSAITLNATIFQINTDLAHLSYTPSSGTGADTITVDVWDPAGLEDTVGIAVTVANQPASDPVITAPASETIIAGANLAISGVAVADAFAASAPGSLTLRLSAGTGTVTMNDASGAPVPGSGTSVISVSGTLAQLDADLTRLVYAAPAAAGHDNLGIDILDQAGQEATAAIAVTVNTKPSPPPGPPPIFIAKGNASPVILADDTVISASAGNHNIFLGGVGNDLTATGGTETVMAFLGSNSITTGTGNDTIRIAGSGDVVDAGGGRNQIQDSGGQNTIILPAAGQGFDDIYGYILQTGDVLDLRKLLAATTWAGNPSTLSEYLRVTTSKAGDAQIQVIPDGQPFTTPIAVATLHGAGQVSLGQLLAAATT